MIHAEETTSASKEKPAPASSAWQLEFVRLIGFPTDPPISIDQHWWRDLASDLPADFVSTQKQEFRDDRGSFQGVLLALTVDTNRVIWEARSPRVVDQSGFFPTLGPFQQ